MVQEAVKIMIPDWMRKERPMTASFCDFINLTLKDNPKITLAELAMELDRANKEDTYKRIVEAQRKQFGMN